jgi:hypothetical protein
MKDLAKYMGPILYHICITEFPKRGLPHTHITLALKNIPQTATQIASLLTAEVPRQAGHLRDLVRGPGLACMSPYVFLFSIQIILVCEC